MILCDREGIRRRLLRVVLSSDVFRTGNAGIMSLGIDDDTQLLGATENPL